MRIAIYARVSSPRQAVENQLLALRQWAAVHGHEVAGEFADVAPGDVLFRPQLRVMVRDAQAGRFDAVAVVRLDRVARCEKILAAIASDLAKVQLLSLADETPADAMAVAAAESRLIGQRSREGIQRAREEGVRIGRPPKPTLAERLAPRLAQAAAGMRQLQGNRSVS